jgi:Mrp family chromosome partitioning ATPase
MAETSFLQSAQYHFMQRRRHELLNGLFAEAMLIKNQLLKQWRKHRVKTVVFASANSNEGVAATMINLVNAFNQTERTRLLLVDANFRTSGLSACFGKLGWTRGLLDVLGDSMPVTEALHTLPNSTLHFLSRGRKRRLPELLMRRPRLQALLRDLESRYDLIFLEAPPLRLFPDGYFWGQLAQGLLLVIRSQQTPLSQLARVQHTAKKRNIAILGNVINRRTHFGPYLAHEWFGAQLIVQDDNEVLLGE